MPRITGTPQRIRPAAAQKRAMANAIRAPKAQTIRIAPRANLSSSGVTTMDATATAIGLRAPMTSSTGCCCSSCGGLECLDRTRFFAGQLLTDTDLNNEQQYLLAKNRLHNRYLHGWGVVCGLQVTCSDCPGWVTINPGYAIDPCGNDIIVCQAQSFNVLQAIQACNTPSQTAVDCSPLRYRPMPNCTDAIQEWCITVQYQEQATQMVTPLQQSSSSSSGGGCSCGCGGNSNKPSGCGCGGNGNSSSGACGCGGSSSASSSSSATTTAACQPTRIIEGFQFGVCTLPEDSSAPQPGTFLYQAEQCVKGLIQLAEQAPDLVASQDNVQQAYQATLNYYLSVQQYFLLNSILTNCKALNTLNQYMVPSPTQNTTVGDYQEILRELRLFLVTAILDCVCLALLPQCPPDPCDTRVSLACVTVQNGTVMSICHFECRQQLIGFNTLQYWLEPLFAAIGKVFDDILERFCCSTSRLKNMVGLFPSQYAYNTSNFTTNGFTNSAMFNRTVSSFVSQKMGASMVNTINPNMNAMDMRPFVGQPLQNLQASLDKNNFYNQKTDNQDFSSNQGQYSQLDVQAVDNDPSWDLSASTASSQYAPAAVSAGQPLTVYVKGTNQSIVGIEVTDPTRALQLQVQSLTDTVTGMKSTIANMQPQNPSGAQTNPPPGTETPGQGD